MVFRWDLAALLNELIYSTTSVSDSFYDEIILAFNSKARYLEGLLNNDTRYIKRMVH